MYTVDTLCMNCLGLTLCSMNLSKHGSLKWISHPGLYSNIMLLWVTMSYYLTSFVDWLLPESLLVRLVRELPTLWTDPYQLCGLILINFVDWHFPKTYYLTSFADWLSPKSYYLTSFVDWLLPALWTDSYQRVSILPALWTDSYQLCWVAKIVVDNLLANM